MNFLPSLTAWQFAAAGALLALGPVIIHLLNRRQYRVVQWAAMDFLREALERNRKMLQIRDLILLALRTLAVLLFGLALARPFFSSQQEEFSSGQPLHAILLVDNSLSMGFQSSDAIGSTLLAKAQDRARQFVELLPSGSQISVIPLCGSREGYSPDPYATHELASEAIGRIAIVDRQGSLLGAINEAKKASEAAPELAKRIVLFSDAQQRNFRDLGSQGSLAEVPPMQIVDVGTGVGDNTWIADIKLQDGLADIETPTTIVVTVAHAGTEPRQNIQVTLALGETVIGEKTISLEAGASQREVDFEYVFSTLSELPEPQKPVFVSLRASLTPDRLPEDDERSLAAPVVAALPVLFIDQYGAESEDPIKGRLGETRHLRQLLAPRTSRSEQPRQLVRVEHITPAQLTQELLAQSRLVVIAGIEAPGEMTPLLRDYVRQGGQLLIAAGADFNPARWNEDAWLDGQGILPVPLASEAIGEVPEVAGANLQPFNLAFDSLSGESYFQLAGVPEDDLRDLYSEPFFFKAISADARGETLETLKKQLAARLVAELEELATIHTRREELAPREARGELSAIEQQKLRDDADRLKELRPTWLVWATSQTTSDEDLLPADPAARARKIAQLVDREVPRVIARYDDPAQSPFLIERRMGRGQVMLVTTGVLSSWNTLPKTNAVLVFDRILRSMTEATLPRRNFPAIDKLVLPLPSDDADLSVQLLRPKQAGLPEPLDVGYIGTEQRGVTLASLLDRGIYEVVAYRTTPLASGTSDPADPASDEAAQAVVWRLPIAIAGDPEESELAPMSQTKFEELTAGSKLRWVGAGDEISLAGTAIRGQYSWWYLVLLVLILLLVEMSVLAWPTIQSDRSSAAVTTFPLAQARPQ